MVAIQDIYTAALGSFGVLQFIAISILSTCLYLGFLDARYRRFRKELNGWPGFLRVYQPLTPPSILLRALGLGGTILSVRPFTNPRRHAPFVEKGWNVVSLISLQPKEASLWVADADAIKQITSNHSKFPKPAETFRGLLLFGKNIVATEGDEWRRHRKVSAPAFSERNNRLVWNTTVELMNELFDSVWGTNEVHVDHFVDYTVHLGLMVLSVAGFGNPMTWASSKAEVAKGQHKWTFFQTVTRSAELRPVQFLSPKWLLPFFKKGRMLMLADKEMRAYLNEIILARRQAADKDQRWDILTNLIRGGEISEKSGEEAKLSPSELVGNVWVYILAGHETTASALYFAVVLLAIFEDEQQKLFAHIKEVLGDREPTYDDHSKLTRVQACFYEGLRLYPIVNAVPKRAAEDTVITTTRANPDDPETANIVVKKGTIVSLNLAAVQLNPRYWKEPERYMPERFMGDWNRDALLAFSAGTRGCIGRKFSETEALAALTLLISRYTISLSPELKAQYAVELKENPNFVREKILTPDPDAFALGRPPRVPLVLKKRY